MEKKSAQNLFKYLTIQQKKDILNQLHSEDHNCFGLEYDETTPECKLCHDNINCLVVFSEIVNKRLNTLIYDLLEIKNINPLDINIIEKILNLITKLQLSNNPMTEIELTELIKKVYKIDNTYIINYLTDKFIEDNKIKLKHKHLYYEK